MNVLVLMSGGVDSSVAAALLADAGHDLAGATLRLWGGPTESGCCAVSDVEDARRVAQQLGLPHYVFDHAGEFERLVVEPYVAAYSEGRTPNPCVDCNVHLKFGIVLDRAAALGFDAIATGHHARIGHEGDHPVLRRGADRAKDQSYVLALLGREELTRVLLPVGELTKAEVRARASELGLRTAAKPESMDACFVTAAERAGFVHERAPARPGVVVDTAGRRLGEHAGVATVTIGQRRGLGITAGERRFVVDVDAATATITVGARSDLLRDEVLVDDWRFGHEHPARGERLMVQVRAHATPAAGAFDGDRVRWLAPQPRVAPGQVVALYRGDEVVGGGIAA